MTDRQTQYEEDRMSKRLTNGEVGRIVNAAKALVEAHERRSSSSQHATLGEESALFELNFRLGAWRQSRGMKVD